MALGSKVFLGDIISKAESPSVDLRCRSAFPPGDSATREDALYSGEYFRYCYFIHYCKSYAGTTELEQTIC